MFKVLNEIEKENYTQFVIEPLEAGFGHTMGNGLRRVLLSSLEGNAVTSVKIEGVPHMFSNIKGVAEEVIGIILNIKKLRVKVFSDKPIRLKVSANGKGEVKAKDLEIIGDGEVANPELVLATITDPKTRLNMEMVAEKGKGYSMAEERKSGEIGTIAVDALFSPVINVNYKVEPTRVGRRIDLDKLVIEIETDGTIKPAEALNEAAKILSATFKQIYEPVEIEETEAPREAVVDETLKMSIEEIDLPVRIANALKAIDVNTVEELVNVPRTQLLKAKNLGTKSLSLISEKLAERGLSLSEA